MWVILLNNADWDCFKTLTSREISKIQNPLLEEHCAFWKSYICSNKLDVQETDFSFTHSSAEAEVISLDAGLRVDGIPALDLWDLVIEVLHYSPNQFNKTMGFMTTSSKRTKNQTKAPTTHDSSDLFHVDKVPLNGNFSF